MKIIINFVESFIIIIITIIALGMIHMYNRKIINWILPVKI